MPREKKTEIITLRVTPRTKAVIQARAKSVNKTVTDYLCLCGLGKEIVQVDGLDKVLSELKAQGRNLNQLTTLANMGKVKILRGDTLADKYGAICEQLRQLLREVTRWLPSPQSKTGAEAGARSPECCGTRSRRKRRCGKDSGW